MNSQVRIIREEILRRRDKNYRECHNPDEENKAFRVMEDDAILSFIDNLPDWDTENVEEKAAQNCIENLAMSTDDGWNTTHVTDAFFCGVEWKTRHDKESKTIEEIKCEIERRMDELWDSLPEASKVDIGDFTERDANTIGKFVALESILDFITKQNYNESLTVKSERVVRILEDFSKELSETPFNNTPITDTQLAVKALITFFKDPNQYDPDKLEKEKGVVKERIIAAAYKVKPEYVCERGGVWKVGTQERDDIYRCRIGRHHAEILHCFGHEVDHETDGFYTSFGRWVDRKEAAKIALACGQVKKLHYWNDALDSSDLFDFRKNDELV